MKITTTMLKKLDGILEGDLPSSRQGLATLASKLKDPNPRAKELAAMKAVATQEMSLSESRAKFGGARRLRRGHAAARHHAGEPRGRCADATGRKPGLRRLVRYLEFSNSDTI